MSPHHARLTLDELRSLVTAGEIDTVVLALTDMQGRLQGKRVAADHFLAEIVPNAAEGCDYLLAVDVEMNTVEGYENSSWDTGYGDLVFAPDLDTLRLVPWHPATAMVQCDVRAPDGRPVPVSPRQILRRQLDRLARHGWYAYVGTELEFMVFADSYEQAWDKDYQRLTPVNQYNVDYSILGTGRVEPLLRRIRNGMAGAGLTVESAKGECNPGQHEIAFRYDRALVACDDHAVYKTGAKEIAAQEGVSLTFMAKYNEREGNSCHIHLSLRDGDGAPVMPGGSADGFSPVMEHFIAGQLACLADFALLLAPNVNSYKRYAAGSFAPTALAWGRDNRTCAVRVVGHGPSLRFENRVPGGDVNPYLAVAAVIAAGLHGVEAGLPLPAAFTGNAYASDAPRVPATLRDAVHAFEHSAVAARVLRRGRGAALRPRRARGTRRLRRGGHRLGAAPRFRAPVSGDRDGGLPLIGISSYLDTAAWGVWRQPAALIPQSYVDGVAGAGGLPVLLPPQARGRRPASSRCSTGCCWPAARTSTPRGTAGRRTRGPARPPPPGTPGSSRCSTPRWPAAFRCSACAAACRCSTPPSAAPWSSTCPTAWATPATSRPGRPSARRPYGYGPTPSSARSSAARRPCAATTTRPSTGSVRGCCPWPGPRTGRSRRSNCPAGGSRSGCSGTPRRTAGTRRLFRAFAAACRPAAADGADGSLGKVDAR